MGNEMVAPKRITTHFVCRHCDFRSVKWLGRCPQCGEWNSLVEQKETVPHSASSFERPVPLMDAPEFPEPRLRTAISEFDRVLGGGIVPGSAILIGGDPGIGKSTLLLHVLAALADQGAAALYICGEESPHQVKMRAHRLGALRPTQYLSTERLVEAVCAMAKELRPALIAVDSIQTMRCHEVASAPGSLAQVRESTARLVEFAKKEHLPIILVGHVTKDGAIAGPRVLEHMVDTVLYFEGERYQNYRLLRTVKNRFGSTNEIGVFAMSAKGLEEIANPSALFLAERPERVSGSVVVPSMEGSRPILVEVQALVSPSYLGTPRRTAIGTDPQRVALLCAVLEKKGGLDLAGRDIYINIAGGIKISEPALDLGVVVAMASSVFDTPVEPLTAVCGEVGLAGEVRMVSGIESRIQEARRLGFGRLITPVGKEDMAPNEGSLAHIEIGSLAELMDVLFG